MVVKGAGDEAALLVLQGDEEGEFVIRVRRVAANGLADLQRAHGDGGVIVGVGDDEGVGRGLALAFDIEGGLFSRLNGHITALVGGHAKELIIVGCDQSVAGGSVLQVAAGIEVEDGGLRGGVMQMQVGFGIRFLGGGELDA